MLLNFSDLQSNNKVPFFILTIELFFKSEKYILLIISLVLVIFVGTIKSFLFN